MPTSYECAVACQLAYNPQEQAIQDKLHDTRFRFLRSSGEHTSGYRGIAMYDQAKKEVLIAHRGTIVPEDLLSDAQLARGRIPASSQEAHSFSRAIRQQISNLNEGYAFFETGHSLGAIHAELNAHHFKSPAISFESPGARSLLGQNVAPRDDLVTTFLSAPNPVNTLGRHVGRRIRIYIPHAKQGSIAEIAQDNFFIRLFSSLLALPTFSGSVTRALLSPYAKYYANQHSIDSIVSVFDQGLRHPILQRAVDSWPQLRKFLSWLASHAFHDFSDRLIRAVSFGSNRRKYNIRIERLLMGIEGLQLGRFVVPNEVTVMPSLIPPETEASLFLAVGSYRLKALESFDQFHNNAISVQLRSDLEQCLNFSREPEERDSMPNERREAFMRRAQLLGAGLGAGAGVAVAQQYAPAVAAQMAQAGWGTKAIIAARTGISVGGAAVGIAAGIVVLSLFAKGLFALSDFLAADVRQERDALNNEIRRLAAERQEAQGRLEQAEGRINLFGQQRTQDQELGRKIRPLYQEVDAMRYTFSEMVDAALNFDGHYPPDVRLARTQLISNITQELNQFLAVTEDSIVQSINNGVPRQEFAQYVSRMKTKFNELKNTICDRLPEEISRLSVLRVENEDVRMQIGRRAEPAAQQDITVQRHSFFAQPLNNDNESQPGGEQGQNQLPLPEC